MSSHPTTRRVILAGLYWGAIWGLYEATVGYLVHAFARMPGTSSMLLVPFAVFCMVGALTAGGTVRSAAVAAATAASIKLINLALPNPTLLAVFNPTLAILLEGAAFMVVAHRLDAVRRRPALAQMAAGALVFSFGWRVLFLAWSAVLAAGWSTGLWTHGLQAPLGFLVRDGLLSALVIVGVLALVHRGGRALADGRRPPATAAVAALLVLAVAAEVMVGLLR